MKNSHSIKNSDSKNLPIDMTMITSQLISAMSAVVLAVTSRCSPKVNGTSESTLFALLMKIKKILNITTMIQGDCNSKTLPKSTKNWNPSTMNFLNSIK
jgi:hypothetical protein